MFDQESIALEYWRKKYFFQAGIVIAIALSLICLTFTYADFIGLKILVLLCSVFVCYLMLKELREDLQTRGEALVLAHAANHFKNLSFDYGKGIKETTLLSHDIAGAYQILEYYNILQNDLFHYEEDFFYSIISSKFLSIEQTSFKGIILSLPMPSAANTDIKKTTVTLNKDQTRISGFLSEKLKSAAFTPLLNEICTLFKPQKIDIINQDDRLYFWIKTNTPLFHQFSLTSKNSIKTFVTRIEKLQTVAENITKAFA